MGYGLGFEETFECPPYCDGDFSIYDWDIFGGGVGGGGGGFEVPYDDFRAKILPIVCAKAKATGIPVVVFWFRGEILMTYPDCSFRVVAVVPTNADAINWAKTYGATQSPIWGYFGNGAPTFIYFGAGEAPPAGGGVIPLPGGGGGAPVPGGGGVATLGVASYLPWIAIGGIVLFAMSEGKRK